MAKFFLLSGALNALLAIMLGAFGAHALREQLQERMLEVFHTASQYHFYHALGLMIIGMLVLQLQPSPWFKWSGWLMLAGILLFSGSLYLLAVSRIGWLGIVTPFGGTAFILAWLSAFIGLLKN